MSLSLDQLIRRDRTVVALGLLGIVALSWAYMIHLAREMAAMPDMALALPQMKPWGPADLALTFLMWAVMMAAMMIPSAAPMILIFTTVNRKRQTDATPVVRTGLFLLGYIIVWTAYSLLATLLQWALRAGALTSGPAVVVTPWLGALLLLAAGVYQLTPLKNACLARCQSPLGFLLSEWRQGGIGALMMGLRHGAFCVGCCWVLMVLLFVAGVMNLLWVAALAAFVLIEKVAPVGRALSWSTGAILIAWGGWLAVRAL